MDPTRLPSLLRTLRANLFPNNSLGQGKPPPASDAEIAAIKRQCALDILSLVPVNVRIVYFGSLPEGFVGNREDYEVQRVEREVLDVFADGYLNKHWVFAATEVIICRLFPELEAKVDRE